MLQRTLTVLKLISLAPYLLSFRLRPGARSAPSSWNSDCKWIEKPDSASEKNDLTKLKLWEECVLLNITKTYLDSISKKHGDKIINRWKTILFTNRPADYMTITIHKLVVSNLNMNEQYRTISVNGHLIMSWMDQRLTWDPDKMGLSIIRLHRLYGDRQIWFPKISTSAWLDMSHSRRITTVPTPGDTYTGSVPTIRSNGNVTLKIRFAENLQRYSYNYAKYPYDIQEPCFPLQLQATERDPAKISFKIVSKDAVNYSSVVNPNGNNGGYFWKVQSFQLKKSNIPGRLLCAKIGRHAPSARIELLVPLALTAFLAVFAPFFGSFRYQTNIKVLALVLQYLCMQAFIAKTKNKLFGDNLPNILRFHEFLMITTMISLMVSLALWTLKRIPHNTPPPNVLTDLAERINRIFICTTFPDDDRDELIISTDDGGQKQTANVKQQWDSTVQFLNNAFFVLFSIIYAIGMLALCIP